MLRHAWVLIGGAVLAGLVVLAPSAEAQVRVHEIDPAAADPAIKAFREPHVAIYAPNAAADAPLVLFMPGTGGKPSNAIGLLRTVAEGGRPVIGLEYIDDPAVVAVCSRNSDPACSADFRQMRIYGTGPFRAETNTPADSIEGRLASLLVKLDKDYPGEGWGRYLAAGRPDWSRIVVSGQSQGAGMAAYIAKAHLTARVVLFSSPWDFMPPGQTLAPWLSTPSATPPERWFAAYNRREATAALLAESYRRLGIPPEHIRALGLDLPPGANPNGKNPYHGQGIHDPRYRPEWLFLYGLNEQHLTNQ
jgi:hypothetical protein